MKRSWDQHQRTVVAKVVGGIDKLLTTNDDGTCTMEVELKTLTSAKSKGGVGELSDSRRQAICDDAEVGEDRGSR